MMQAIVRVCRYVSMKYAWFVIITCAVLLIAGLASLTWMHVDIDYARRFKQDHPLRTSMEFFNQKLAGSTNIEVFVSNPNGSCAGTGIPPRVSPSSSVR